MGGMSPNTPPPRKDLGPDWSDDGGLAPEQPTGVDPVDYEHIEPEALDVDDPSLDARGPYYEPAAPEPVAAEPTEAIPVARPVPRDEPRGLPTEPALVARQPMLVDEGEEPRDLGRYWPLFLLGGLLLLALGWMLLSSLGDDDDPVAPGPAPTATQAAPTVTQETTETVTEEGETVTQEETVTVEPTETVTVEPEPTDAAAPPAPTGQDQEPTRQEPAPTAAPAPEPGADLEDASGAFGDGVPDVPGQVASAILLGADQDAVLYEDPDYGVVTVRFDADMTDTDVAALFGQGAILVEEWVCGPQGSSYTCAGQAHGGRALVTADASPEEVAGWGRALVEAWVGGAQA